MSKLRFPISTPGTFRASNKYFYLRNDNSGGSPDISFVFGLSTDKPVFGDWDGDNDATIGVYRPSTRYFYLRNSNSGGAADESFSYGASTDTPICGDWDGY